MSTTLSIGRWPAAISRWRSQSGDGPIFDVLEDARGEAQADVGIGDLDARVVVGAVASARLGVGVGRVLGQRRAGRGVDLAGDPVDGQAVGPVRRDLQLERLVGDRQHVGERRARQRSRRRAP